jgi:hypothetical protein
MIQVPVHHPMIKETEPITYIFVSTGDISRDAAEEFDAYNKRNLEIKQPEIQLWNRAKLVNLFYENMESLPIFSSSLQNSLARIWLDIKSTKYNRLDWFDFVKIVCSNEQTDNKSLPFLALGSSFLVSQARSKNEFFVAFDVLRIALVNMWTVVVKLNEERIALFDQLHYEYCRLIEDFAETLTDAIHKKEGLYCEKNGVVESILYPLRTFSLLGTLSYLAYFWGKKGEKEKEKNLVELIETIIQNNPSALTPIADYLKKDIVISLAELCRNQKSVFAEKWIQDILENLNQRYIRSGWWPSESDKPEDIVENTFHFEGDNKQPVSFLISILFTFCAKLGAQKTYNRYRVLFSDFTLLEYIPPDDLALAESELIQGIPEHGTTIEKKFPNNFRDFCQQVSQMPFKKYSPIEKNRPYVLQMMSDVHLHHVFPEIYLNFS